MDLHVHNSTKPHEHMPAHAHRLAENTYSVLTWKLGVNKQSQIQGLFPR
jgi:hypothetical protein